jgi:hypothetical protein
MAGAPLPLARSRAVLWNRRQGRRSCRVPRLVPCRPSFQSPRPEPGPGAGKQAVPRRGERQAPRLARPGPRHVGEVHEYWGADDGVAGGPAPRLHLAQPQVAGGRQGAACWLLAVAALRAASHNSSDVTPGAEGSQLLSGVSRPFCLAGPRPRWREARSSTTVATPATTPAATW